MEGADLAPSHTPCRVSGFIFPMTILEPFQVTVAMSRYVVPPRDMTGTG